MSLSNNPDEKTVFIKNSDFMKSTGSLCSKNSPRECAYCHATEIPEMPHLVMCFDCRSTYVCNDEHMEALWPTHEILCLQVQRGNRFLEHLETMPYQRQIPNARERRLILEDWNTLHRYSIRQALASALQTLRGPIDWTTHYFLFELSYRPKSRRNPSSAFEINSVCIKQTPRSGTPNALGFEALHSILKEEEKRWSGIPPLAVIPCLFHIDGEFCWLVAHYVYQTDVLTSLAHNGWLKRLQFAVRHGLVYRLVRGNDPQAASEWAVGLVSKKDKKWQWERKTVEEFLAIGIVLRRVDLLGSS
ncbi:hypothetical protein SISNIDRAFT_456609 [Sistotremastrum niveocremeum HHB9708]|uniref:MYND-type domain-containing protein n=1 Tax=Sistotremastrum niveocremeum HHB9708 TaxID=1314777 RepID=A0A164SPH5_9AGAM|nr:hypothetical protein SISNIDRAFT_456609 [Sistotremastrum niveocremeum HHB9708]